MKKLLLSSLVAFGLFLLVDININVEASEFEEDPGPMETVTPRE